MKIDKILTQNRSLVISQGRSKKRLLEKASQLLSRMFPELDSTELFEGLIARERLGSTAIGDGVAIPHCRVPHCREILGMLILLDESVDFDATDDQPVDLLFILLVPMESTHEHLETLALLSNQFSDPNYCEQLRAATDSEILFKTAIEYTKTS
ncbi:MAG: PTS IIA-like nitrogen regulatory protein PtsN [Pseudomonadales bacterium]|nr:PTS IIA-like nitrogen regulatory protein PtsN [Pseudomonadales bacterium]